MDQIFKIIEQKITSMPVFQQNGHHFITYIDPNLELVFPKLLHCNFFARNLVNQNIMIINISFLRRNRFGYMSNSFILEFGVSNHKIYSHIDFDIYLKRIYREDDIQRLSLNYYKGNETDKVDALFEFLGNILEDDFMKKFLAGQIVGVQYVN